MSGELNPNAPVVLGLFVSFNADRGGVTSLKSKEALLTETRALLVDIGVALWKNGGAWDRMICEFEGEFVSNDVVFC